MADKQSMHGLWINRGIRRDGIRRAIFESRLTLMRDPVDFLCVVYCDEQLPLCVRMRAAMVERTGRAEKIAIKVHAHMLRHACGYALANAGHDTRALQAYLGHREGRRIL
jgi:site-specific recombinase XerD